MKGMQRADYESIDKQDRGREQKANFSCFRCLYLKWLSTKQSLSLHIGHLLMLCFVAVAAICVLGPAVLPGSEIFAFVFLYTFADIMGEIANCFKLPPLLGMLIAGFLFRNLPFIPYYEDISVKWASTLRGSAFVIILLKAGIGLDSDQLRKLKTVVLQLSFIPCIVETVAVGVASHLFLKLPWMWAIMLGFVVSAVSAAVVVPCLLDLQDRRYGTRKGVPTLAIAATSVDNILAITGFSIVLSITLSGGSWLWSLGKGVLEPLAGLIFGLVFGCVFWFVPGEGTAKGPRCAYRILLLTFGGLAVTFGSKEFDFAGAGPFGCLVLGFVAAHRWKKDCDTFTSVENAISFLWKLLEPFLFSLIGSEVTFASLGKDIELNIITLSIGSAFHVLAAFVATFGAGLNIKEKIFMAFTWLPKATVQAAIGAQALDYVLAKDKNSEMEDYAKTVLRVAVLSIVLTAPLGAILITMLGPILLEHNQEKVETDPVPENPSSQV